MHLKFNFKIFFVSLCQNVKVLTINTKNVKLAKGLYDKNL